MRFLPDFSADHVQQLTRLGVTPGQLKTLRQALLRVRDALTIAPAHADVNAILADIGKLAEKLSKRLGGFAHEANAHLHALALLEPIYWRDQRVQNMPGPNAAAHLRPLLDTLAHAAREGRAAIPKEPVRHKTAAVEPVEAIFNALLIGWPGDASITWDDPGSAMDTPPPPSTTPFPKQFRPSASPTSEFSKIVGICYEAMGGNASPERAIKAYMARRRKQRARDIAAFTAGVDRARRGTKRPKTRGVPS